MKPTIVAKKMGGKKTAVRLKPRPGLRRRLAKIMPLRGGEGSLDFYGVVVGKKDRTKERLMLIKQFSFPSQPVSEQFRVLNQIRRIPELRPFVPPTVRLIRMNRKEALLLTDLT